MARNDTSPFTGSETPIGAMPQLSPVNHNQQIDFALASRNLHLQTMQPSEKSYSRFTGS